MMLDRIFDLSAILPTSLPVSTFNETLASPTSAPPPLPPQQSPQLPSASTENDGEDFDDSSSNSDDE